VDTTAIGSKLQPSFFCDAAHDHISARKPSTNTSPIIRPRCGPLLLLLCSGPTTFLCLTLVSLSPNTLLRPILRSVGSVTAESRSTAESQLRTLSGIKFLSPLHENNSSLDNVCSRERQLLRKTRSPGGRPNGVIAEGTPGSRSRHWDILKPAGSWRVVRTSIIIIIIINVVLPWLVPGSLIGTVKGGMTISEHGISATIPYILHFELNLRGI